VLKSIAQVGSHESVCSVKFYLQVPTTRRRTKRGSMLKLLFTFVVFVNGYQENLMRRESMHAEASQAGNLYDLSNKVDDREDATAFDSNTDAASSEDSIDSNNLDGSDSVSSSDSFGTEAGGMVDQMGSSAESDNLGDAATADTQEDSVSFQDAAARDDTADAAASSSDAAGTEDVSSVNSNLDSAPEDAGADGLSASDGKSSGDDPAPDHHAEGLVDQTGSSAESDNVGDAATADTQEDSASFQDAAASDDTEDAAASSSDASGTEDVSSVNSNLDSAPEDAGADGLSASDGKSSGDDPAPDHHAGGLVDQTGSSAESDNLGDAATADTQEDSVSETPASDRMERVQSKIARASSAAGGLADIGFAQSHVGSTAKTAGLAVNARLPRSQTAAEESLADAQWKRWFDYLQKS